MPNRAREFKHEIGIGIGRSICSERPREDKSRELIPHIGPTPIKIPGELSDSQSYVLNFTYFDSRAKSHAMLHDVRESNFLLTAAVGKRRVHMFCGQM